MELSFLVRWYNKRWRKQKQENKNWRYRLPRKEEEEENKSFCEKRWAAAVYKDDGIT
jgi:hypothetical protein